MIRKPKEIYLEVAKKHSLPVDLIVSIGNIVYQETRSILNNPQQLSYELPELGTFNMRFKKFEAYFSSFQKRLDEDEPNAIILRDTNLEKYLTNKMLYDKMQEYRKDKQETRIKRYEQNKTLESSKDNPS